MNNFKKSVSISVLERPAQQPSLAYYGPEYDKANPTLATNNSHCHSSLLILDKFDSSDDYGRIGIPLVKNTDSDDIISSVGTVSQNSRR